MPRPRDLPVIDTMMGIPRDEMSQNYEFMRPLFMDEESKKVFSFPAEYMFRGVPKFQKGDDHVGNVLRAMDEWGIEKSLVGFDPEFHPHLEAMKRHRDRFLPEVLLNPNRGMDEVRRIEQLHDEVGLVAVSTFPAGLHPQVPFGDARFYPIFAKLVDLGLPIFACMCEPGPRIPMAPQLVDQLDEVCWFFPELKVVIRHGAEPWADLAVKLMLKWPNLFYSTSAFAPRHYPKAIVDYANTRGADKVLYAGYFPAGLSIERLMTELDQVPFADHVWPKFLHENARRVLGL